jgi:hypothetical protein
LRLNGASYTSQGGWELRAERVCSTAHTQESSERQRIRSPRVCSTRNVRPNNVLAVACCLRACGNDSSDRKQGHRTTRAALSYFLRAPSNIFSRTRRGLASRASIASARACGDGNIEKRPRIRGGPEPT